MVSRLLLIAAAIYLMAGVAMGMYMGSTGDQRLRHVHVHIGMLGWISLSIIAMVYQAFPRLGEGWVPKAHLALHNLGLLLFMGGIAHMQLSGQHFILPVVVGSSVLSLAIGLWSVHVIVQLLRKP